MPHKRLQPRNVSQPLIVRPRNLTPPRIVAIQLPQSSFKGPMSALYEDGKLGPLLIFDPTNPFVPFGEIPSYLQDNYGLLVQEHSGELIHLPLSSPELNRITRTAQLNLLPDGSIKGEVREVRTGSQTGPLVTTLNLTSTGNSTAWADLTFPISLQGKNDLFLVFRSVTGGATGSMFLLNWVEFKGNGVTVQKTTADGSAGGTVPATLSLSLGAPATFGAFTPGVAKTYEASATANVISTAGDATLSVAPQPAFLANGAFTLPQPLQVAFSKSTWTAPTSNESVTIGFKQPIGANDALRTGAYSKTLTFTLSTTTP